MKTVLLIAWLMLVTTRAFAGEVSIEFARFIFNGQAWSIEVTLKHQDSGWEHYADAWRVVDPDGNVLATRTLLHPHVNEQPFTRALHDVAIPAELSEVVVESHDNVHGWSKDQIFVDLTSSKGSRYEVQRSP